MHEFAANNKSYDLVYRDRIITEKLVLINYLNKMLLISFVLSSLLSNENYCSYKKIILWQTMGNFTVYYDYSLHSFSEIIPSSTFNSPRLDVGSP